MAVCLIGLTVHNFPTCRIHLSKATIECVAGVPEASTSSLGSAAARDHFGHISLSGTSGKNIFAFSRSWQRFDSKSSLDPFGTAKRVTHFSSSFQRSDHPHSITNCPLLIKSENQVIEKPQIITIMSIRKKGSSEERKSTRRISRSIKRSSAARYSDIFAAHDSSSSSVNASWDHFEASIDRPERKQRLLKNKSPKSIDKNPFIPKKKNMLLLENDLDLKLLLQQLHESTEFVGTINPLYHSHYLSPNKDHTPALQRRGDASCF